MTTGRVMSDELEECPAKTCGIIIRILVLLMIQRKRWQALYLVEN